MNYVHDMDAYGKDIDQVTTTLIKLATKHSLDETQIQELLEHLELELTGWYEDCA